MVLRCPRWDGIYLFPTPAISPFSKQKQINAHELLTYHLWQADSPARFDSVVARTLIQQCAAAEREMTGKGAFLKNK